MKHTGEKKSRNVLLTITVMTFLVSSLLFLGSSLFFRTYENHLTVQKQKIEEQIISIQTQNEETQNEVNDLASSKRVTAMADSSLTYQGQNVEAVTDK